MLMLVPATVHVTMSSASNKHTQQGLGNPPLTGTTAVVSCAQKLAFQAPAGTSFALAENCTQHSSVPCFGHGRLGACV